jgi:hypothetical protein
MSKEITREVAERMLARMKAVDPEAYLRDPDEHLFETAPRIYFPKFGKTLPLGPSLTNELVAAAVDALRAEGILPPPKAAHRDWTGAVIAELGMTGTPLLIKALRQVAQEPGGGEYPHDTEADRAALVEELETAFNAHCEGWGEEPKGTEEGENA